MKTLLAVAVLLVILVLAEVQGSRCPYTCKRYRRSNCLRYRYWTGTGTKYYTYCRDYTPYLATCYTSCVHGGWTDYSDWELVDDCPVYCGGATARYVSTRSCSNPEPQGRGNPCVGESIRYANKTCNPEACGKNCPADVDTYFAHPQDKKSFYHCSAHGTHAHLKTCDKEDTVWDQKSLTCVHTSYNTPSCEHGEMTPHPTDCGKFFHCSGGLMYMQSCPGGLHFDAKVKACNWPTAAKCAVDEATPAL